MKTARAAGSWPSPLSAELCTAAQHGIAQLAVNGAQVLLAESRPEENGRTVLLERRDGAWRELAPKDFNLRTRVHEYGGLALAASGDQLIAVNDLDQRLYRIENGKATPLTPESAGRWRFAEPQIDLVRQCVYAVAEEHQDGQEPINRIVRIPLAGGPPESVIAGDDFYAYPRLSPDGGRLAWISWNHPDMPWDGTLLQVGSLSATGTVSDPKLVAGGRQEAVIQPEWRLDGSLICISDRAGYWNLYDETGRNLWPIEWDCGGPLWQLGARWFTPLADGRLLAACSTLGRWRLAIIDDTRADMLDLPFVDIGDITLGDGKAYFRAGASDMPAALVELDLDSYEHRIIYRAGELPVAKSHIARPESFRFDSQGRETFAHYYPPTHADIDLPAGERPPLIVMCHGGPTSAASTALRLSRQFWTNRGFAICDVDYGGSTGYGRPYRERLVGMWGIVDVEDCIAAARHLVEAGLVDPDRLIIRGGSAGGFTVLAALTFHDTFKAGSSSYGIGDLELLAGDTHKFESRYLESMIGPYPAAREVYRARSPIHHVERLDTPVIFFQGLDDKVVPPNQAETMVAALKAKGVPVAYLAFPGEGHGFRKSATKIRELESELAFYAAMFDLAPADPLPPLTIDNHRKRS